MTAIAVVDRSVSLTRRWLLALAAVVGVVVIGEHLHHWLTSGLHVPSMTDMPGMSGTPTLDMPGMHPVARSLTSTWVWWTLMVVAMMVPLAVAGADQIAADSLWSRRRRAVAEYLAGYLAVWSLFGVAATSLVIALWPVGAPAAVAVVLLVGAAAWQTNPIRKRALRRCGNPAYIRVRGWRADTDCVAAGVAAGRPCLIACAPVMTVMAVTHSAVIMVALTALLINERRRGPNPHSAPGGR